MKHRLLSLVVLIALALVSVVPLAAQEAKQEGFPLTIVDGAGRELTFDAPPERVMCYYTNCIEAMVGLGLKPSMVPEWFLTFPNPTLQESPGGMDDVELIALDDSTPSAEAIAAAQPDLVMVYSLEEAQALADIAPTFVTYPTNSIGQVVESMGEYGQLFGEIQAAEEAVTAFMNRRAAYAQLAPGNVRVMNVLVESDDPTGGDIYVRSTNSPDCALLEEIAQCPWTDANPSDSWSFLTNIEYLLQQDPDVILIATYGIDMEAVRDQITADPLWSELSAVKNGRLILNEGDLSADGIVIATRFLNFVAPALYPEVFPAPLTDEQVAEILVGEAAASNTQFPVTVVDGDGKSITLNAPPQRIVCFSTACVYALAVFDVVPLAASGDNINVALDELILGEAAANITEIFWADGGYDMEAILALQPDLVVSWQGAYESMP